MNIALLNGIYGRKVGEIDLGQQICARSSVNGMELEIYYFLGEPEPIKNLLRGFDVFRHDGKAVLKFVVSCSTTLTSEDCYDFENLTIKFVVDQPGGQLQHILVSSYGDLLVVCLPDYQLWRKANLGWLEERFKDALVERGIVFSEECTS